jgi:signal transduction histidine kinase/streptogramin lyase
MVEQLDRNSGLINEGGTSALVDREMNTWITGYRGITKITSERFSSLSENNGLLSNEVAAAIEASPGNYIFGHDGALTYYDGTTMTPFILDPERKESNWESRVLDIQKDASGNIWIAASSLGVARLNKKRQVTWFRDTQGIDGVAYTVAVTPSGIIYAGTTNGLFIFNNGRFIRVDLGKVNDHSIRKVFSGPRGTILCATFSSGLVMIKGSEVSTFTSAEHKLANNVYAFFIDSKGRQWVGTAGGLFELEGKELKWVNRDGLMVNRPVYLILEDHLGNLWFGTDNGVFRWNGKILDHFTVNDGMSGHDINRAAGFIDSKNHIWFGTNNGLTVFKPEFDYAPGQIPPPKVKLLSVIVGKDSLDPNQEKVLPYDLDDLVFKARVISLINERQNLVRFYLEGFDTGWSNVQVFSGNRFVYNNLRPGSYRFFIKAQNVLGIWSNPIVSETFYIQQPFWFRWWFLTLGFLIFTAITIITARYILVNRYKNRLKDEVSLRTAELRQSEMKLVESNAAKDSFFSIIAHDLRNPFNVILGYLDLLTSDDSEYTEEEQKQILLKLKTASARTIDLLENLLTWAQAQRGRLPFEPEFFMLGEVIAESFDLLETSAHSKNISMTIKGRQDLRVFADRNMISTVVRNLMSNALKFTFPGGTIIIGIEEPDMETVLVSVKDNGMGISPEILENLFKIEHRSIHKGTANETGTGLGLILCKEFINKNGGTLRVTSTPGSGSTFTFTLPSAAQ